MQYQQQHQQPQTFSAGLVNSRLLTASIAMLFAFFLLFGAVVRASAASAVIVTPESDAALGDKLFQSGDYRGAIHAYSAALRGNPTNSTLADSLGVAYARAAETSELPSRLIRRARANFERALQVDPQNTAALQHLIELSTNPVALCSTPSSETANYIDRLAQIDPAAASAARHQWHQRLVESQTAEARFACAPASIGRTIQHTLVSSRQQ